LFQIRELERITQTFESGLEEGFGFFGFGEASLDQQMSQKSAYLKLAYQVINLPH
jgi:hypothetical protein